MTDVNVLVVFYSRHGKTEQLALAAGVGAIQAKASIRLRRLADLADLETIHADPEWTRNLDRMNMDYVPPRPADPLWADVIVLATPGDSSIELERYVDLLRSQGSMEGKIAAPLATGHRDPALKPIYALAACAGFVVVPAPADGGDAVVNARTFGRRVAQMARALKERGS
jgi:NAD(P)H dehydrogenase (quinone)